MCFGDTKQTGSKTETKTIPAWLSGASEQNINDLRGMRDQGYQAYTGQRVADLSGDETQAGDMIRTLAGSSNPYTGQAEDAFSASANGGPSQVSTVRAIDNVPGQGADGSTADYMDPYLKQVLAPMLAQLDEDNARTQNSSDARATMAGAFGDSGAAFERARNTDLGNRTKLSTVGNAYSNAFNNAMALKTGDINRNLDVSKTNAALNEQGLARRMAGGNALLGLDKYNTGRQADLASMLQKVGAGGRAIDQAKLDATYQEFSNKTGYPLQMSKLIIDAINGSPSKGEGTSTSTSYAPDNSGYGFLGSLLGAGANFLLPGSGALVSGAIGGMAPSGNSNALNGTMSPGANAQLAGMFG